MDQTERIEMLKTGRIAPTLLKLSLPTVIGMLVMAAYNLADTFFVALLRDTASIAATGIVFPIFQLIGAIGLTFGMGSASVISRRLGENKHEEADRTASTAFYTALIIGILFAIFGATFTERIMRLFGATDSIIEAATLYGRIILGGSLFQVLNMTLNNIIRSEGAAGYSSIGMMLGAGLNILLDPIFIFLLDMGVAGAATATIIAQGIATVYLLYFFVMKKGVLHLRPSRFTPSVTIYTGIMALGLPTFVRQILGSISFGLLNNAAGNYGDSAIAAVSITARVFMLVMMIMFGLSQGLQPLAGYNYGARCFDRVRRTLRISAEWSLTVAGVAVVVFFIFASPIMRLFAPQNQEVIRLGTLAMRMMAAGMLPIAFAVVCGGFFQALGKGRAALLLALGQQGLFLIPLLIILPRFWGIIGIFVSQPVAFGVAFVFAVFLLRGVFEDIRRQERSA